VFGASNLWALDVASGSLAWTATLNGFPEGLDVTPDGSKVYVPLGSLSAGNGVVAVVDAATGAVSQIGVGPAPQGYGRFIAQAPSPLAAAVLPGARTVQLGTTATVFARPAR
jgi:DNA-binding beta-propeller fold protein YncE